MKTFIIYVNRTLIKHKAFTLPKEITKKWTSSKKGIFEINEKGKIEATVELVEHIGRDNMIISRIKNYDKSFRAIVPSGLGIVPGAKIKFSYSKIFVFNKETGRRLI